MNIAAWECDHSQMRECCEGCGHFSCPCGINWDEGAEGHFDDEIEDLSVDVEG